MNKSPSGKLGAVQDAWLDASTVRVHMAITKRLSCGAKKGRKNIGLVV